MTNDTVDLCRLAILVTRMDIGGVPDHIMTLLDGLGENYDVTLICDDIHEMHHAEAEELGVKVVRLPMQRLIGGWSDWQAFRQLSRILKDRQIDILHTHMSKAAMLGAMIGLSNRRITVVNTGHNFGFVAMPQAWKKAIFWAYDRFISSFGHAATIAVSQTVAKQVRQAQMIPQRRLHPIQNGIRLDRFDTHNPPPTGLKGEVLGDAVTEGALITCVARLVWFKGLHVLIDALPAIRKKHPDTRVLIVGDGELRADLIAQAERVGVADMVVFAGERGDIPDLLKISDIFVLPSVSEGLPISLMEAMASELPLVASRVGGIPELIEDGVNGYLCDSQDADSFAKGVLRLLDDPKHRRAAGRAGRKRLEQHFSQRAMVQKTETLYTALMSK